MLENAGGRGRKTEMMFGTTCPAGTGNEKGEKKYEALRFGFGWQRVKRKRRGKGEKGGDYIYRKEGEERGRLVYATKPGGKDKKKATPPSRPDQPKFYLNSEMERGGGIIVNPAHNRSLWGKGKEKQKPLRKKGKRGKRKEDGGGRGETFSIKLLRTLWLGGINKRRKKRGWRLIDDLCREKRRRSKSLKREVSEMNGVDGKRKKRGEPTPPAFLG